MESKELKEMKKEFSVKKFKEVTVYTLESATGGGTSSGSVASVSMPMGGVRKRGDNLIAQEGNKDTVPATTPRNFVAKNAKTSGAGAHKDKKKAEKQGDVKHKKPYAESLQEKLNAVLDEDHSTASNGWGKSSYDTYTDGRHGRGVAEVATVANRKFPNPRKPYIENGKVTGIMGPDGKKYMMSKSDTVGADGMIYHWQDPRARGKTGQQGVAKKEQGTSGSIQEAPGTADEIAKFILANIYDRGALQKYAFQTPNPTLFWNGVERAKQGGRFNDIVQVVTPTRPWHKMEESDVEEEPGQHRVAVKVTDPKTQDDVQKVVRVNASSKQGALERAEEYYTKKGMYVVNAKYLGKVDQGIEEGWKSKLAEKISADAPVDIWVKDFQKADPNKYHQFKNKTPEKKSQMAVAASYAAKNPNKKK